MSNINMNPMPCSGTGSLIVRIWPDGTFATLEDIREGDYSHMSDDYEDLDLYDFDKIQSYHNQSLMNQIIEEIMGQ